MNILLHTCCAPCLSGSRIMFEEEGLDITAYWFNPNIAPYNEHQRRLHTLQRYLYLDPLPFIQEEGYGNLSYMVSILKDLYPDGNVGGLEIMTDEERRRRCAHCYGIRLFRTAEKAKEMGFSVFSTTMLLSKHQDHEAIRAVCREAADEVGIDFVYRDLRTRWKDSIRISRELGLYRQPYCGCIFSEHERFQGG